MFFFFFFNDTATTEIYTLSLHDALPISAERGDVYALRRWFFLTFVMGLVFVLGQVNEYRVQYGEGNKLNSDGYGSVLDRKSTRLNSSHANISYAVFCLKKKKTQTQALSL